MRLFNTNVLICLSNKPASVALMHEIAIKPKASHVINAVLPLYSAFIYNLLHMFKSHDNQSRKKKQQQQPGTKCGLCAYISMNIAHPCALNETEIKLIFC